MAAQKRVKNRIANSLAKELRRRLPDDNYHNEYIVIDNGVFGKGIRITVHRTSENKYPHRLIGGVCVKVDARLPVSSSHTIKTTYLPVGWTDEQFIALVERMYFWALEMKKRYTFSREWMQLLAKPDCQLTNKDFSDLMLCVFGYDSIREFDNFMDYKSSVISAWINFVKGIQHTDVLLREIRDRRLKIKIMEH
jgi:hypothetical protein